MKKIIVPLALAFVVATTSLGGELGSAAAPLKISEWVKGQAVDLAAVKGKQMVVVEFWATWCPPCRTSIPHLTEMQKKFKDVIFIGVTDEASDVVKKFVTKMGDKMDYVVAIDDERKTSDGYMKEFDINGIPHAFIVDKEDRIVWQGHPMAGLDTALEQLVAGKYDLAAEKAKAKEAAAAEEKQAGVEKKLQQLASLISEGKDNEQTKKLEAELLALDKEAGGILNGNKFEPAEFRKTVKFQGLMRDYQIATQAGKGGTNLARIEKLLAENAPPEFKLAEFKESLTLNKVFANYYYAATGRRGMDQLADYAKELGAVETKNAQVLNQWAWTILTDENIKDRDLVLAAKLAKAGVAASEGKDSAVLDTYARALFEAGKVAEAIEQQQKAVNAAEDDNAKKELGETLQKYQDKAKASAPTGA